MQAMALPARHPEVGNRVMGRPFPHCWPDRAGGGLPTAKSASPAGRGCFF